MWGIPYHHPMTENLLDIEYLKSLGRDPKWFGLGFIQLKLSKTRRMHFWHPDLLPNDPAFVEEYHDHRYNFTSDVLVGEITNRIATAIPSPKETGYSLFDVCCSGGGQIYRWPVELTASATFTTKAGGSYFVQRDTFHRVEVKHCVTLQTRSETVKDKARVIQLSAKPSSNPFDGEIEVPRLWEYIAELLPPAPGYHIAEIPKGELGEASKIFEEALELRDAVSQGARVMQLVELSDMLGAVEAFLDKHHSGYSLDDLRTFSDITKRAFRNGHRV